MPSIKTPTRTKILAPGQTAFHADGEADVAYLVREGVLIVSQTSSSNGREAITSVYFPGEICGGFAVLTGMPHSGTARAPRKGQTVVEPIRRGQLLDMVSRDRELYTRLLATQYQKERFKEGMLLSLMANTCEQRMASTLLFLAQGGDSTEPLQLSRQELADLIGTTMETVIRLLSRFRKMGLIVESEESFQVDVERLSALAEAA